jgi:hypothetical protein
MLAPPAEILVDQRNRLGNLVKQSAHRCEVDGVQWSIGVFRENGFPMLFISITS